VLELGVELGQFDDDHVLGRAEHRNGVAARLLSAALEDGFVIAGDQAVARAVGIDQRPGLELGLEPGAQGGGGFVGEFARRSADRLPVRLPFQAAATGDEGGEGCAGIVLVPARQLAPLGGLQGFFGGLGRFHDRAHRASRTGLRRRAGCKSRRRRHGDRSASGDGQQGQQGQRWGEGAEHDSAKVRCLPEPASLTDLRDSDDRLRQCSKAPDRSPR
jgi:hypothetical protein